MTKPRVLLVSYHFPPVGGAGVQRIAKFARYLPEFGWDVSVLQASNPSVPLLDHSLLADLPADLVTARARTFEPGYAAKRAAGGVAGAPPSNGIAARIKRGVRRAAAIALQPDAQVLWYPDAMRQGKRLLRRVKHDVIVATAPSYTNLLVGARLAAWSGLPLVTDFRDEWDLSSTYWENAPKDAITVGIQRRLQRYVLRRSDVVVATTEASTARLATRAAEATSKARAVCIYNGWDANDIAGAERATPATPRQGDRFRLVYAGTLWNLTSIAPLADAVSALPPELLDRLELVIVGRKTPEQRVHLDRMRTAGALVTDVEYCDHHVALATLRSGDALLLLLSDVPGAERVAPAKAFEYFALGRPILAILPDGETAGLVREAQPGAHLLPSDIRGITSWLTERIRGAVPGSPTDPHVASRFERRALTGQLATLLDALHLESR